MERSRRTKFPLPGNSRKVLFQRHFIAQFDTLNYAIQICHRNQFLYLLRFAFNFVINGVDLINRSLRIFLSIFDISLNLVFFFFLKRTGFKLSFKGIALDDAKCFLPDDYLTICR